MDNEKWFLPAFAGVGCLIVLGYVAFFGVIGWGVVELVLWLVRQ